MTSWTCCDCCTSRDDVSLSSVPPRLDEFAVAASGVCWLCARCRAGQCPDCGPT